MNQYKIIADKEYIDIEGILTIEEAFDFINFYDKKGFKYIKCNDDYIRLTKKTDEEENEDGSVSKENHQDVLDTNLCLINELESYTKRNKELNDKIVHLEELLKKIMLRSQNRNTGEPDGMANTEEV